MAYFNTAYFNWRFNISEHLFQNSKRPSRLRQLTLYSRLSSYFDRSLAANATLTSSWKSRIDRTWNVQSIIYWRSSSMTMQERRLLWSASWDASQELVTILTALASNPIRRSAHLLKTSTNFRLKAGSFNRGEGMQIFKGIRKEMEASTFPQSEGEKLTTVLWESLQNVKEEIKSLEILGHEKYSGQSLQTHSVLHHNLFSVILFQVSYLSLIRAIRVSN